ncbi:TPA: hypothetical protein MIQ96_26825 [Klebsiella pneumoniae]|nr:hypothetical protein [Klebsiella pneumoniae]HBY1859745.1 hypothetical protein [Klebsiella pneumoniae]
MILLVSRYEGKDHILFTFEGKACLEELAFTIPILPSELKNEVALADEVMQIQCTPQLRMV